MNKRENPQSGADCSTNVGVKQFDRDKEICGHYWHHSQHRWLHLLSVEVFTSTPSLAASVQTWFAYLYLHNLGQIGCNIYNSD